MATPQPVQADATSPEAGLSAPSPTLRRDAMGGDMMKKQALAAPGAIPGAGDYVYQIQDDNSITILHDPTGQADGVNLTTGKAFDAIKAELQSQGFFQEGPEFDTVVQGIADPGIDPIAARGAQRLSETTGRPPSDTAGAIDPQALAAGGAVHAEANPTPAPVAPERELDMTPGISGDFNPFKDTGDQIVDNRNARMRAKEALDLPPDDPRKPGALESIVRQLLGE